MKNEKYKIAHPTDILPLFEFLKKRDVEYFYILMLDGAHNVIQKKMITKGLLNRTLVHPREVYREAIRRNAASIVAVHNHPSGICEMSIEDTNVTQTLKDAGEIIGIKLLDHIVVAENGHYSAMENSLL